MTKKMPAYLCRTLAAVFCFSCVYMQCYGNVQNNDLHGNIEIVKPKDLILTLKKQSENITIKNISKSDVAVEIRPDGRDIVSVFPSDFVLPANSSQNVTMYVATMPHTGISKNKVNIKSEKIEPGNNKDEYNFLDVIVDTTK